MLTEKYRQYYDSIVKKNDSLRIFHDPLHTLAFGTDASFYRLIPQMVIIAGNENDVILLLEEANKYNLPVTFRAAGTSLSGQSISDSILILISEQWNKYEILENGLKIKLEPGLRGGKVNKLLLPYGRKIGPDPASINAAMVGGIAANNASGMCCGIAQNSYNTVDDMRIIFPDGTLLDTGCAVSRESFVRSHVNLVSELVALSEKVKKNRNLSERILQKFKIKNTIGYSINALLEFTDPFEIIKHLMIGSEGTLGFISEITYKTVPEYPYKASSLMIFPDIENACKAVGILKGTIVSAVELIDRIGLRSVENEKGIPAYLKSLPDEAYALLVETRSINKDDLFSQIEQIKKSLFEVTFLLPVEFTDIPPEYELLWKIRKGLFPSVGAMRDAGTTVIIEDVAFPFHSLPGAVPDLRELLRKHNYDDAVIFGHVLDGNLHFVFKQDFGNDQEIVRYQNFIEELTQLVVNKYDGSLKAEHGTGRNMAPFVELEWGREVYELITRIKTMFDPENLLNPGVIINADPKIHLKNLKPLPVANSCIDKCIECGFCEASCVSSELTLSPRQRITVYREISSLTRNSSEPHRAAALVNLYDYYGDQTCATDGLCELSCPVKIDTGKFIKYIRQQKLSDVNNKRALWIADHFGLVTKLARTGLTAVSLVHQLVGTRIMQSVTGAVRKVSRNRIPQWNYYLPRGARRIAKHRGSAGGTKKVVYFPSCINRSMGISRDRKGDVQVTEKTEQLLTKAGFDIIYPANMDKLCCGMAFSSKGYREAGLKKSNELEKALLEASLQGAYPVLCDMSPCLYTMKENFGDKIKIYEPVEFILEYVIPHLNIKKLNETVAVFPVCSMKKMELDDKLVTLAKLCAENVIVPETNCCGFAGDRGFSFPELNEHGLRNIKAQIPGNVRYGYSTSRTCEIGLSKHSGIPFRSILYLVDEASN